VLLAWLFAATLTTVPHLRAHLAPPPGLVFTGFFFWRPDMYNYLTFVQQAEDGAFLFENKLEVDDSRRVMINLEWWTVGRLSAALGRRPNLAYQLVGLAGALALLAGTDRWLRLAGLPDSHRLPALVLVSLGGGLGGIRYTVLGPPAWRSLDLVAGPFPFIEFLANPHFVAGTTLLIWALLVLHRSRSWRGDLLGIALAAVLGLVRPYDLVLLVAIRTLAVAFSEPPARWFRLLLPLAALSPVALYLYWVFYRTGAFTTFFSGGSSPPLADFAVALGPAAVLATPAILGRSRPAPADDRARGATAHLVAWALVGIALVIFKPVSFFPQFLVGIGLPLLALGALGLARLPPAATLAASAVMCTTAFVAMRIVLSAQPLWFVPAERMAASLALRGACRRGDRLFAPPDIGLFAIGLTACKSYVSERYNPEDRDREVRLFYGAAGPAWRAEILDRACISHLVLPDLGPVPARWLGEATQFRQVARVGRIPAVIGVYERVGPRPCRRP
jgi:hypothetical protein